MSMLGSGDPRRIDAIEPGPLEHRAPERAASDRLPAAAEPAVHQAVPPQSAELAGGDVAVELPQQQVQQGAPAPSGARDEEDRWSRCALEAALRRSSGVSGRCGGLRFSNLKLSVMVWRVA
jgi:hypothetical protein